MNEDTVSGEEATPEERRALFRVVRGDPSDEEVAALTVVLAAVASAGADAAPASTTVNRWSAPAARMRPAVAPGPGGWRASAWPR